MTNKYFFILGNTPALSLAELYAFFGDDLKFEFRSDVFVIIRLSQEISSDILAQLAGTVKMGRVFDVPGMSVSDFSAELQADYVEGQGKVHFGFSQYSAGEGMQGSRSFEKMALTLKKDLSAHKISSRWVISREPALSAVVVSKNKLLKQGAEFVRLSTPEKMYWGKTMYVQPFEAFAQRDHARPARSMEIGMLPPKVARMMVNIASGASAVTRQVLLDPFCGTGTVAQEALLRGYKTVYCTDLSEDSIAHAKENIIWLINKESTLHNARCDFYALDVRDIPKKFKDTPVDVIVTEPYLGPAQNKAMETKELQKIQAELTSLYADALQSFARILKPGGRVLMIFPVFVRGNQRMYVPLLDRLEKFGFSQESLLPTTARDLLVPNRGTIVYGRPGQFVWREMVLVSL